MEGLSTPVTQASHNGNVANHSDVAQRAAATLKTVRSACDRLAANLARTNRLPAGDAAKIGDELHRFGSWCVEVAEHLATSANIPSPWESDLELYALLDAHFPDGDTIVCPVSRRQLSEGVSDAELFAITVDTGECTFDVDAREADLRKAIVSGLRGIAERNLAAADAIDQATGAPLA